MFARNRQPLKAAPFVVGQVQGARAFSTRLDEGGANERKAEGADPLAIFLSTPAPVVEVAHQFTIVSAVRRRVSECPSEDSYIVFEGCDEVDVRDLDFDSNYEEDDDEDVAVGDDEFWGHNQMEQLRSQQKTAAILRRLHGLEKKKVRFAPDERLAVVHPMIMWSFAYRASRKGPWEEYGRDRARFLRRIECCRQPLERILSAEHRDKVYAERFARPDLLESTSRHCGEHRLAKRAGRPKRNKRRRNGKKKKKKGRHKRRR